MSGHWPPEWEDPEEELSAGTDQWNAEPSRKPAPSPTPKSRASGIARRRPMIGPTAILAIRLSIPSSRKPI